MNMYTLRIMGDWSVARGKLKEKYAALTDSDLYYVDGREDELLARIEKGSGARREEIERFLSNEHNFRLIADSLSTQD